MHNLEPMNPRRWATAGTTRRWLAGGLLTTLLLLPATLWGWENEASPEFVGVLAYAVDDEGARALKLDDETRAKLLEIVEQREQAALQLTLANKDLPANELAAKLVPFVAESERQGLELLTQEQRSRLAQLKLARVGLVSLADVETAQVLELTDEQKEDVAALLERRDQDLREGNASQRRIAEAVYERRLDLLLTPAQRARWATMTGRPAPVVAADPAPMPADQPPADTVAAPEAGPATPVAGGSAPASEEANLVFNFADEPWGDVFDWLAEESNLALLSTDTPDGTFHYRDPRKFTPTQAMDLVNSVLLTKGYTMVRRDRMLLVFNLEEPLPPDLVELVDVSKLDELGQFNLVKCMFHFAKLSPEDAQLLVERLVGPGRKGLMVVLPQARQIVVTETAGNLRMIRDTIEAAEKAGEAAAEKVLEIKLKHILAEELLGAVRPLLALEEGAMTNDQINLSVDVTGTRVFAIGMPKAIEILKQMAENLEVPLPESEAGDAPEKPELRVYNVAGWDIDTIEPVIRQLLADIPDGRATFDRTSESLLVVCRPTDHKERVEALLATLKGETQQTEVIQLRNNDPDSLILTLNKLLKLDVEGASGPTVDSDPINYRLYVHGTPRQIEVVRSFVQKLEGTGPDGESEGGAGLVRRIPMSAREADDAIRGMSRVWPTVSKRSSVREVEPSNLPQSIFQERAIHPPSADEGESPDERPFGPQAPSDRGMRGPPPGGPQPLNRPSSDAPADLQRDVPKPGAPGETRSLPRDGRWRFVAQEAAAADDGQPPEAPVPPVPSSGEKVDILVSRTRDAIFIWSEDEEELDRFETLMRQLFPPRALGGLQEMDFQVYYLKYVDANQTLQLLKQVLQGTSTSGSGSTSGGSLIGDMAGQLLGGGGPGQMLGQLLGGGGGGGGGASESMSARVGSVDLVADRRLNRIFASGLPEDIAVVEQVLQMLDKQESITDIETDGKAHVIRVIYTTADEVARVIREAFAAEMTASAQQGQNRQPSPEDLVRALAGGRGGRGGGGGGETGPERPKMTVTVDTASNSLIVVAPEPLFRKVLLLVAEVDKASSADQESFVVVPMTGLNPTLVQGAMSSIFGAKTGSTTSGTQGAQTQPGGGGGGGAPPPDAAAEQQRQAVIEAIRRAQQAQPQGGGGRGGPTGGPGGAPGGGFPGFGGGGPGGGFGGRGGGGRGGR